MCIQMVKVGDSELQYVFSSWLSPALASFDRGWQAERGFFWDAGLLTLPLTAYVCISLVY